MWISVKLPIQDNVTCKAKGRKSLLMKVTIYSMEKTAMKELNGRMYAKDVLRYRGKHTLVLHGHTS